jgi:hypothetical protein
VAILAQPASAEVAQVTQRRKHRYRVNMAYLISKLKETIVPLFRGTGLWPLLTALGQQMVRTFEAVRPHRSYPRKQKLHKKRYPRNYYTTRQLNDIDLPQASPHCQHLSLHVLREEVTPLIDLLPGPSKGLVPS